MNSPGMWRMDDWRDWKPLADLTAAELRGLASDYCKMAETATQTFPARALRGLAGRYEKLASEREMNAGWAAFFRGASQLMLASDSEVYYVRLMEQASDPTLADCLAVLEEATRLQQESRTGVWPRPSQAEVSAAIAAATAICRLYETNARTSGPVKNAGAYVQKKDRWWRRWGSRTRRDG